MKKFRYLDIGILVLSAVLLTIGLTMILSSSNITAYNEGKEIYYYFARQLIWVSLGAAAGCLVILFSNKFVKKTYQLILIVSFLSLIYVLIKGAVINGASSWIKISSSISFQPSEIFKVIFILWTALYYDKNKDTLNQYIPSLLPIAIAIVAVILIGIQPDLGTAIIFTIITAIMFWVSPVTKEIKFKLSLGIIFLAIGAALVILGSGKEILKDHQKQRFDLDGPCAADKFYHHGNQLCNSYIAINNGGLTGRGIGKSTQKYLYIPLAYSDFIFPVVVEELGAIISIAIVALIFILVWRIIMVGRRSINIYGRLVCYGVASYVFVHTVVNLVGVLGLLPMTGVPLPFISYGGTFTLSLIIALSFVQKVNIETRMNKKARKIAK